MDFTKASLALHKKLKGKIEIKNKYEVFSKDDLSLVYSPGVAAPCLAIHEDESTVYDYTMKGNTVAIVSDGSAVLGLGNIGAKASIPVMEGKAMLFKMFAGINAIPICLETQDPDEIVTIVKNIAPIFGGVNLEDISAPRSFYIEQKLQDLGIPVFHDDQHGTAVVVLAGLINAAKLVGKSLFQLKVVINGSGAAGIAIARLIRCTLEHEEMPSSCLSVKEVIMCDSKGIIHPRRNNLNDAKKSVLSFTNPREVEGSLQDALKDADVFIGVSVGNLLTQDDIRSMAPDPIIFALANPTPEIMPDLAYEAGAAIVGTGRSDMPNQINNVLGFPGIFKGALKARAKRITAAMKLAAAYAIADNHPNPSKMEIIPTALNLEVANNVAVAVEKAAREG